MERVTITIGEWESRNVDVPKPTLEDEQLVSQLLGTKDQPRLRVRWLHNGRAEIETSSWVGLVRFSSFDIRVVPKLCGGSLRLLRMLDYAGGLNLLKRLPTDQPLPAEGADLLELVALLLVEETKWLLRNGLLRDYRHVEDGLPTLRGRLRYRDQMLRRYGQLQTLDCSFDEYDGDVVENQLLAAALHAVRRRVAGDDLRAAAMQLTATFDSVCTVRRTDPDWYEQRIVYGRRNGGYRAAHELALLILRGCAFDDHQGPVKQSHAFMVDMNKVFERFLTRLLQDAVAGTDIECRAQSSLARVIMDDRTGKPYTPLRPDLVIEQRSTGRAVPVDIKYKLYAERQVSTSDIYQLFVYAYALAPDHTQRRAGVLYPATTNTTGPNLSIRSIAYSDAATIAGTGVDVPAILDALGTSDRSQLFNEIRSMVDRVCGFSQHATVISAATVSSSLRVEESS